MIDRWRRRLLLIFLRRSRSRLLLIFLTILHSVTLQVTGTRSSACFTRWSGIDASTSQVPRVNKKQQKLCHPIIGTLSFPVRYATNSLSKIRCSLLLPTYPWSMPTHCRSATCSLYGYRAQMPLHLHGYRSWPRLNCEYAPDVDPHPRHLRTASTSHCMVQDCSHQAGQRAHENWTSITEHKLPSRVRR
jgi:hypothetical protein